MIASLLRLFALRPILTLGILGIPVIVLIAIGLFAVVLIKFLLFIVLPIVAVVWLLRIVFRSAAAPRTEEINT
jgi:hypothetical protein